MRYVSGDIGNDRPSTFRLGFLEVVYQSANPRLAWCGVVSHRLEPRLVLSLQCNYFGLMKQLAAI
jgi:hypothetical protein